MKTLSAIGITLIVGGILLASYGYGLCAYSVCTGMYCQSCETVVPLSRLTVYTGIAVMLGGIGFLVYSLRKSTHVK